MGKMKIGKVIENGGATVDARADIPIHDYGYYVSAPDREKTFPLWIVNPDLFVADFISRLYPHDEDYQYPDQYRYIGFWVHDDKLYCDMSTWVPYMTEAIDLAIENHQLGFWDISKECEVILDRDIPKYI